MLSKAELLERFDELLKYMNDARAAIDQFSDASRKIANDSSITLHDADLAMGEVRQLGEMLDADEIAIDADSMRVFVRVLDATRDIVTTLGSFQDVYDHLEKASHALISYDTTFEDVIKQSRQLVR